MTFLYTLHLYLNKSNFQACRKRYVERKDQSKACEDLDYTDCRWDTEQKYNFKVKCHESAMK